MSKKIINLFSREDLLDFDFFLIFPFLSRSLGLSLPSPMSVLS